MTTEFTETLTKSDKLNKQVETKSLAEKIGESEAAGKLPVVADTAGSPPPPPGTAEPAATPVPALLVKILGARRCHGSKGDMDFRTWLFNVLKSDGHKPRHMSDNLILELGNSKTLFSCHVDTCHSMAMSDGGAAAPQKLAYDPGFGHLVLDEEFRKGGNVLGADDGSGIYIMLRMIQAKIPGAYIFHVGEEKGGIGSNALAGTAEGRKWLSKFDRAVAFDRAGDCDVIVTQGSQACASIPAGEALASALVALGLKNMKVSHRGSFTDTKVYRNIIPECFNLSVGYRDQHGPNESQDVPFLESLVEACLKLNWDALKVFRDPRQYQDTSSSGRGYGLDGGGFGGGQRQLGYDDADLRPNAAPSVAAEAEITPLEFVAELENFKYDEILDLVTSDPGFGAKVIAILGAKLRGVQSYSDTMDAIFC